MKQRHVILGQVVTEKSEAQKSSEKRVYALRVSADATKVAVKNELQALYAVQVVGVRIMRVGGKTRSTGRGGVRQKRHPFKKALITLSAASKPLDLASFVS